MSPFFQTAAAFVAEIRLLVDDIGRGLVLGGLAGAIIVVLDRGRRPAEKLTLAFGACTLMCVVGFLVVVLIFD